MEPRQRGSSDVALPNEPTVAVVVPTYNRKVLLGKCIDAILSQTVPISSVLVVDNASADGTPQFLRERGYLEDRRVEYVRLHSNIGGAGGFKVGLEHACKKKPDWIWLMDDDVFPSSHSLQMLLREADNLADPVSSVLVSYQRQWGETSVLRYRLPRSVSEALRYYYACPTSRVHRARSPALLVDWFPFVSVLLPGSAVEIVGFPREDLFLYADDLEYALRLRSAGYKAYVVPASLVTHRQGRSDAAPARLPTWRWYYIYRNGIIAMKTEGRKLGIPIQLAALVRITAGALARALTGMASGRPRLSLLILRGLSDGYRGKVGTRIVPGN